MVWNPVILTKIEPATDITLLMFLYFVPITNRIFHTELFINLITTNLWEIYSNKVFFEFGTATSDTDNFPDPHVASMTISYIFSISSTLFSQDGQAVNLNLILDNVIFLTYSLLNTFLH